VVVKNPVDIDEIFESQDYADEKAAVIGKFVLDSVSFDTIPFQPEEIVIEFIQENKIAFLSSYKTMETSYKLNK
jgi:hypothetical protein